MARLDASERVGNDQAGQAIATVLRAEREAQDAIARTQAEAAELAEAARAGARAVAERTDRRIRAVVAAFEHALAARLAGIEAQAAAAAQPHVLSAAEHAALVRAVQAVARELTEAPP
jgi:hypothetical protein